MATIKGTDFLGGQPAVIVGNEASPQYKKEASKNPGYLQRVSEHIKNNFNEAVQAQKSVNKGELNPFVAGARMAKDVTSSVIAPLAEAPGLKQIGEGFGKVGQSIVDTEAGQKVTDKLAETFSPDTLGMASDIVETGLNVSGIAEGLPNVKSGIKGAIDITADAIKKPVKAAETALETAKSNISKQNVEPQLKTSAMRLEDPVSKYNKYADMAEKAKADIKQSKPLEEVGSKIGDAFEQVSKKRKEAGQVMSDELKLHGDTPTNISSAFENLETSLKNDANLTYDAQKGLVPEGQSKVSSGDVSLLNEYIKQLNELGGTPTVKDVDAFVSRLSSDLDLYKSKNNITGTTQGERLVKNNLNELRNSLTPEATGNPNLKSYVDAKKTYSDLSKFMEEGQSMLGKKTASGDFAKDASMVKSAVQSLLNSGKKDWLVKLEELTGYQGLDDAVLALQAMADSGDVTGQSLLKALYENPPTSKSNIVGQVLDWGISKAKEKFVGSKSEQTRRFLQDLTGNNLDNTNPNPTQNTTTVPASGDMQNSTKSNSSSISDKITQVQESAKDFVDNPKMGLSVENVAKKMSPAEKGTLRDFTDLVNGAIKSKDTKYINQLKRDAQDIAEKYGFDVTKTDKALSKQIAEFLDKIGYDAKVK